MCQIWHWWRLPWKRIHFLSMEKCQLKIGFLNPIQWRSLHSGMLSLHKANNVCIGVTVEGQICSGNLPCATILFLTLTAVSIAGNEKLWRSSFVAFFPPLIGIFTMKTHAFKWVGLKLASLLWVNALPELSVLCVSVRVRRAWQEGSSLVESLQCQIALEKEYINKSSSTCSLADHMNNPRVSCEANTPALASSGQVRQQSRSSCLQK